MFQVGDKVIMVDDCDMNHENLKYLDKPCVIKEVSPAYYLVQFVDTNETLSFYKHRFRKLTKLEQALK